MKKLFILLLNSLLFSSVLCAVQPEVLTVDLDDVVSKKGKPTWDMLMLSGPLAMQEGILSSPGRWWGYMTFLQKVRELNADKAHPIEGASNLLYTAMQAIKDEGYTDFSDNLSEVISHAVDPTAIPEVFNFLKGLKGKEYILIGATNQDYLQNRFYREKMKKSGFDVDDLFDAIVTTRVNHLNEINGKPIDEQEPFTQMKDMIYMVNSPTGVKPQEGYYEALKKVGKKLNPSAKRFIHVDDKSENVEGAKKVDDFEAIHFNLPAGSARKSSPEELAKALEGYKKGLEKLGIDVGQANEKGQPEGALAL